MAAADEGSKRRRPEELPAVALAQLGCLVLGHRREVAACLLLLFDQTACPGRSIEKQHAAGFRAGALPGMRHATRHEGAGAGAADRDLVADLEGDLAGEDIGHLVAVVVQVERALCPGGTTVFGVSIADFSSFLSTSELDQPRDGTSRFIM